MLLFFCLLQSKDSFTIDKSVLSTLLDSFFSILSTFLVFCFCRRMILSLRVFLLLRFLSVESFYFNL